MLDNLQWFLAICDSSKFQFYLAISHRFRTPPNPSLMVLRSAPTARVLPVRPALTPINLFPRSTPGLSAKSCRSCGQWSLDVSVKCCIVQKAPGTYAEIVMLPWGIVVLVKYKCKYVSRNISIKKTTCNWTRNIRFGSFILIQFADWFHK